ALASFHEATGKKLDLDEWRLVLGLPGAATQESWIADWVVEKIRFAMFGRPPAVRPWHPRWPDYRLVLEKLEPFLRGLDKRMLMISSMPTVFTASLADGGERVVRIRTQRFTTLPPAVYEAMVSQFDYCLIELNEYELKQADNLIDRVAPLMKVGGQIFVTVNNRRGAPRRAKKFITNVSPYAPRLLRPAAAISQACFVSASQLRWRIVRAMMRIGS